MRLIRPRIRSVLGTALLLVVCGLAFFTVILPLLLGAQSYTVLTGSMRPSLQPGSLIAVRPIDPADIRVGDVITFQLRSGEPDVATHRVVGLGVNADGERVLFTQGDANGVRDADPVQAVQVRGVLVYAIPWLGYINIWATPAVKSVLITVIGIAAITWGLIALVRDARRRRRSPQADETPHDERTPRPTAPGF